MRATSDGHLDRPDHTQFPFCDTDSRTLLEKAVDDLVMFRGGSYGDPGATISALMSLAAEAAAWLFDAVADARDYTYTWDAIAARLGSTIPFARHRYARYANWRRDHPPHP